MHIFLCPMFSRAILTEDRVLLVTRAETKMCFSIWIHSLDCTNRTNKQPNSADPHSFDMASACSNPENKLAPAWRTAHPFYTY